MATTHRPNRTNVADNVSPASWQPQNSPRTHPPQADFATHVAGHVGGDVAISVAGLSTEPGQYVSPLPMTMPLQSDVKDAGYLGGEKTLQIIEDGRLACSKCDSADFRVLENIMLGDETQLRQYYSREWAMGCLPTGKSRLTITDKRIIQEDLWGAATWLPTACLLNRLSSAPLQEIKYVLAQKASRKTVFYAILLAAFVILGLIIGVASGDYAVGFIVAFFIVAAVGPIVTAIGGFCCMDWMVLLGVSHAGGTFGLTGIKRSEAENVRAILHQAVDAEAG